MPDKKRERWYLAQLRACIKDFPSGRQEDGESPDFIIRNESSSTGIEVTVFHMPPIAGGRPHQELQALKGRVVATAASLHEKAGGSGLYVSVFFNDSARLSKRNAASIGRELAAVVLRTKVPASIEEEAVRVPWDDLPDCIGDITIRATVDGHDRLWSADAGGWVAPVQPDHIQAVLDQKAPKLAIARTKCRLVWLLIVNDEFGQAAPAELHNSAAGSQYAHGFDRVFWLQAHGPTAVELGSPANKPLQPTSGGQVGVE
jgi:hypothetical protein